MVNIKGTGVSGAVAMGKLFFYQHEDKTIKRYRVENTEAEYARFTQAKEQAIKQLAGLYEKAVQEVGQDHAQIFEIHQMMLEDLDYCESVENTISIQEVNAEYAVASTADTFAEMFEEMDDEYMQGRSADVRDVSERVIRILQGEDARILHTAEPVIIVADDLTPSETVQFDKTKILGFITAKGSSNSHTAILARNMNIPAVVNAGEVDDSHQGQQAVIDGTTGNVYIDPDEATRSEYLAKQQEEAEKARLLETLKGKPNVTSDGRQIDIYANIGDPSDIGAVLQNDAGGIGLFRSEFLYLGKSRAPSEDEQFHAYKTVLERMGGKRVIVRTLDIGADKKADYLHLPAEENPALGFRAIRICLTRKSLFKTQLRALYRASAFGNLSIMFPMITSVEEVREIKTVIKEVQEELDTEGLPFDKSLKTGIMIETPAAAIISDLLAKEVDFFSIGSNDLTQYTLAIDRQNINLDKFYIPHHQALLRLIETVVKNAHDNGIWVGICGELGADISLTETFLKIGVDELSVSPPCILKVREKVRSI